MRATIDGVRSVGNQSTGTMNTNGQGTAAGGRRRTGNRALIAASLLLGFVYALEGGAARAAFFIGLGVVLLLLFERPLASPRAGFASSPGRSAPDRSDSLATPAPADDHQRRERTRTEAADEAVQPHPTHGTLEISRRAGGAGRLRGYRVVIDGVRHGKIRQGESREFSLTRGQHEVCLTIDWTRSPTLVVDLARRDRVTLMCWPKPTSERRVVSRDSWICLAQGDRGHDA
jgi:hypothetical protein